MRNKNGEGTRNNLSGSRKRGMWYSKTKGEEVNSFKCFHREEIRNEKETLDLK